MNGLARNQVRRQVVIKFRNVYYSKWDDRTCRHSGSVEYVGRSGLVESLEGGEVRIRRRGADSVRNGHLWVYRSDVVDSGKPLPAGSLVSVQDERGTPIGKALRSSTSDRTAIPDSRQRGSRTNQRRIHSVSNQRRPVPKSAGVDPKLSRRIYSKAISPRLDVIDMAKRWLFKILPGDRQLEPPSPPFFRINTSPVPSYSETKREFANWKGFRRTLHVVGDPVPDSIIVEEDGKQIEVALLTGQRLACFSISVKTTVLPDDTLMAWL
jgi:23S rRNA G2069 N7-methylase RlmK/C1962 C5-methylase RlmI